MAPAERWQAGHELLKRFERFGALREGNGELIQPNEVGGKWRVVVRVVPCPGWAPPVVVQERPADALHEVLNYLPKLHTRVILPF